MKPFIPLTQLLIIVARGANLMTILKGNAMRTIWASRLPQTLWAPSVWERWPDLAVGADRTTYTGVEVKSQREVLPYLWELQTNCFVDQLNETTEQKSRTPVNRSEMSSPSTFSTKVPTNAISQIGCVFNWLNIVRKAHNAYFMHNAIRQERRGRNKEMWKSGGAETKNHQFLI